MVRTKPAVVQALQPHPRRRLRIARENDNGSVHACSLDCSCTLKEPDYKCWFLVNCTRRAVLLLFCRLTEAAGAHKTPTRKQLLAALTLSRFIVLSTASCLRRILRSSVRIVLAVGEADPQAIRVAAELGKFMLHVISVDGDYKVTPSTNMTVRTT